jgi:ABC-2 type transport system permease protein
MSPRVVAIGAGLRRGWIEFSQTVAAGEILGWLWTSIIGLIVLYVLNDRTVPGTDFSLGSGAIPGFVGMNVVLTGMMGLAMVLTMEREDGTLLRMKAIPNGMLGYLTAKVASQTAMTITIMLIVLIPAGFLFGGMNLTSVSSWLMLVAVLILGLTAMLPLGAIVGSLLSSPQTIGLVTFALMGLAGISGVFYPLTALPVWLQWIGQTFPMYWLGLGMRAALLPEAMSAVEVGGSWRHLEMVGMLGAWAVFGFVTAPVLLQRMAARQSGSSVAAQAPAWSTST